MGGTTKLAGQKRRLSTGAAVLPAAAPAHAANATAAAPAIVSARQQPAERGASGMLNLSKEKVVACFALRPFQQWVLHQRKVIREGEGVLSACMA